MHAVTTIGRRSDGVLAGAFAILEILANEPVGLGLTALAAAAGLPKTTAHRLCEQLIAVSAVTRHQGRYVLGRTVAMLGDRWTSNPALLEAARHPARLLADVSRAVTMVLTLDERGGPVSVVSETPRGRWLLPADIDRPSNALTAAGRVLYAATGNTVALQGYWSNPEIRRLVSRIRAQRAVVIDRQDTTAGICCAAAPIWSPDGRCAGTVTTLVLESAVPIGLSDQVIAAARAIERNLART
jgi:DNA-binding IclR family transcriptional regulator